MSIIYMENYYMFISETGHTCIGVRRMEDLDEFSTAIMVPIFQHSGSHSTSRAQRSMGTWQHEFRAQMPTMEESTHPILLSPNLCLALMNIIQRDFEDYDMLDTNVEILEALALLEGPQIMQPRLMGPPIHLGQIATVHTPSPGQADIWGDIERPYRRHNLTSMRSPPQYGPMRYINGIPVPAAHHVSSPNAHVEIYNPRVEGHLPEAESSNGIIRAFAKGTKRKRRGKRQRTIKKKQLRKRKSRRYK